MCNCKNIPVPKMYTDKDTIKKRVAAFADKYQQLANLPGHKAIRKTSYSADAFIKLINFFNTIKDEKGNKADGFRIYFASYSKEPSPGVPKNYGQTLTLIFVPTVGAYPKYNDIKKYYTISPAGGIFDPANNELSWDIANNWALNYQDAGGEREVFNKTLLPPLPTPVNEDTKDTKSIYYPLSALNELANEINCQQVNGIHAKFVTQLPTDNFPQRLDIEFVLTNNINGTDDDDIYIDDDPCFPNRSITYNFDTGSPCPPQCGTGGGTIGH